MSFYIVNGCGAVGGVVAAFLCGGAGALRPYTTLCLKHITVPPFANMFHTCRFDFWDYIGKSMEDDFAQIVGVSLEM